MLDAYGVTDRRRRETLLTLARDATKKGWWQQYDDVLTGQTEDLGTLDLRNEAVERRATIEAAREEPALEG